MVAPFLFLIIDTHFVTRGLYIMLEKGIDYFAAIDTWRDIGGYF